MADLNRWLQGQLSQDKKINVRDDCYLSILHSFQKRFPDAHFETVTGPHLSPLAPPTQLLHAALSRTGQYAPGWDVTRFNKCFLKYLNNSPKAQKRIQELGELALTKVVILVGLKQDPNICGRHLVRGLIISSMNRDSSKE